MPAIPTAARTIDLNADLGEGCPNDRALLRPGDLGEHRLRRPCRRRRRDPADARRCPGSARRGRCASRLSGPRAFRPARADDVDGRRHGDDRGPGGVPGRAGRRCRRADPVPQAARGALQPGPAPERDRARGRGRGGRADPSAAGTAGHRAGAAGHPGAASATSPRDSPTADTATTARSSPGASRTRSCTTPPRWRRSSGIWSTADAWRRSASTATTRAPSTTPGSSAGCWKGRGSACGASPRIPHNPNRLPDARHGRERPDHDP